mmetsp:Transcript_63378/g.133650  ORF Transcript_63378/g.133650 Transcript_63378/m.133650 type:complete len:393 (-) Transcript_63378:266-1444(-)
MRTFTGTERSRSRTPSPELRILAEVPPQTPPRSTRYGERQYLLESPCTPSPQLNWAVGPMSMGGILSRKTKPANFDFPWASPCPRGLSTPGTPSLSKLLSTPTPMQHRRASPTFCTPPCHKEALKAPNSTPPPWHRNQASALRDAINLNCPQMVARLLHEDPFASMRGTMVDMEPVLFAAVREACDPQVLLLLLHSGFDANAESQAMPGLTLLQAVCSVEAAYIPNFSTVCDDSAALDILQEPSSLLKGVRMPGKPRLYPRGSMSEDRCVEYATLLLSYGAVASDELAEMAEARGRPILAHLVRHWAGAQVSSFRKMRETGRSECGCGSANTASPGHCSGCPICLPDAVAERICSFLAPGQHCCAEDWAEEAAKVYQESWSELQYGGSPQLQ